MKNKSSVHCLLFNILFLLQIIGTVALITGSNSFQGFFISLLHPNSDVSNSSDLESQLVPSLNNFNKKMLSSNSQDSKSIINNDPFADSITSSKIGKNSLSSLSSFNPLLNGTGYFWGAFEFSYRKILTIDSSLVSGSVNLTNFPVLIDLYDSDLKTKVQSSGNDIIFVSADGKTQYDHQIEIFDQTYNSTYAHLVAWVKVTSLSPTTDTTLFMYYGNSNIGSTQNPDGVWSDYSGVYHLDDNNVKDSSRYERDATDIGTANASGVISNSRLFSGSDLTDRLNTGAWSVSGDQLTLQTWVYFNSFSTTYPRIISKDNSATTNGGVFMLGVDGSSSPTHILRGFLKIGTSDTATTNTFYASSDLQTGSWYFISMVYDGNNVYFYINGAQDGSSSSQTGSLRENSWEVSLGNIYDSGNPRPLDGYMDESRIAHVARSSDWMTTEYNNQLNPGSFYTIGTEESAPSIAQNYNYYRDITIPHTNVIGSSNLNNFPMYITLTEENFDYKILPDASDILFVDNNGNVIPHEIDNYEPNYNNTFAKIDFWVKIPTLSYITDTAIKMYYGARYPASFGQISTESRVWDSGYAGVWHLGESSGGSYAVQDSTSNRNDGTDYNSPIFGGTGKFGSAVEFTDTTNQRIQIDHDSIFQVSTTITVEAWIKPDNNPVWRTIVSKMGSGTSEDLYFGLDTSDKLYLGLFGTSQSTSKSFSIVIASGGWVYVAVSYDGSTVGAYKNGLLSATTAKSDTMKLSTNTNPLYIGANKEWTDEVFDGLIDEVRFSTVTRSANWIQTEFNNQNNPGSFYSISNQYLTDVGPIPSNYLYKKDLTIDHTKVSGSSTIYDYPVLINIYDSDLKTKTQSDGSDIEFFDQSGLLLPYQIEEFNPNANNTHAHLVAWVRVPKISTTIDTTIRMIYGNITISSYSSSKSVWNTGYKSVLHLNENAGTIHSDSTSNSIYGTRSGNTNTTGLMADGQLFNGVSDQIVISNSLALNPAANTTISLWFKLANSHTSTSPTEYLIGKYLDSNHDFYAVLTGTGYTKGATEPLGSLTVKIENTASYYLWTSKTSWSAGTWYLVSIQFNSNGVHKIFINGVQDVGGSSSSSTIDLTFDASWEIGGGSGDYNLNGNRYLDGTIDEVRISNSQRSSDWIKTDYNNQLSPSTFISIGSEEINYPTLHDFGVEDPGTGYPQFWANVTQGWYSALNSVTLDINNTLYTMTLNGSSLWVVNSTFTPVFNGYYEYTISNATDAGFHKLYQSVITKNVTFNKDIIIPTLSNYAYEESNGYNGTFRVQPLDSWGLIDTVYVNVTSCTCFGSNIATLTNNGTYYTTTNVLMKSGSIVYDLYVNDTLGNSKKVSSIAGYVINKAPKATNVMFTVGSVTSSDSLSISYTYTDYDFDLESGTQIRWYKNGVLQSTLNDLTIISSSYLFKNDQWNVTVKPKDGVSFGSLVSTSTITIQNSDPTIQNIGLTTNAYTSTNLLATWSFVDVDSIDSMIGYNVTWYRDGQYMSSYNNLTTLPSSATLKGEYWNFIIRVYDGTGYSIYYNSSSVFIQNSLPTVSDAGFNLTSVTTTDDFQVNYTYSDLDSDVEITSQVIIFWYINGAYNSSYDNVTIIYATNTTQDDIWQYIIKVYDGSAYSANYTSFFIGIGAPPNTAPHAYNLIITSGLTTSDDLIASYLYVDAESNAELGTKIRWYKGGVLQAQYNNSLTIPASATAKGESWYFTVLPSDGALAQYLNTSSTYLIINTAPQATGITVTTTAYTNTNLTANWGFSDADSDSQVAFNITWYKNGVWQSTYDNKTQVNSSSTIKAEQWNFILYVWDGTNYSIAYNSSVVTILNTAPVVNSASFNQTTNLKTNNSIEITFSTDDQDSDSLTVIVTWYLFNSPYSSKDNETFLFANETTKGQYWFYKIKVFDGEALSSEFTSPTIKIENSAPIVDGSLSLTPISPTHGDVLTLDYNISDIDGDLEAGTQIRWYKNGNLQSSLNDLKTVPSYLIVKDDTWNVTVIPKDGSDFGYLVFSFVIVKNTAPVVSSPAINPTTVYTTDTLTVNYNVVDVDDDTITVASIKWYTDGNYNSTYDNASSIPFSDTVKFQKWSFTIIVWDGTNYSILISSTNITVLNSIPILTSYSFNKTSGITTVDDLQVIYNYYDADNDSIQSSNISIRWYLIGTGEQTSKENQTKLLSSETSKNQFWYYTIQVYDGQVYSILYTSGLINIQNSVPIFVGNTTLNTNLIYTGDSLSVLYNKDDNDTADVVVAQIRWYKNGALQTSLNDAASVSGTLIFKNDFWNVTIRLYDGQSYSGYIILTITVSNTAPTISEITIGSTTVYTTNNLNSNSTFSANIIFGDIDKDNITWEYKWFTNGVYNATYYNVTTIPSADTVKGQKWYFTVQIFDGDNYSLVYTSINITVINSLPVVTNVLLSGNITTLYTNNTLIVTWSYSDADNDQEMAPKIVWYKNGAIQGSYNDSTSIPSSSTSHTDNWQVFIYVYDGEQYSLIGSSSLRTIQNSLPIVQGSLNLSPTKPTAGENLTLTYSYFDLDYDSESGTEIFWYKNGALQVNYNNSKVVPGSEMILHDVWNVTVRVKDGTAFGKLAFISIIIQNTPPQVNTILISATNIYTTTDLDVNSTFSYKIIFFDVDNDNITWYEFKWYTDGVYNASYYNMTMVPSSDTVKGQHWNFTVQIFDGENYSVIYNSTLITILNTKPVVSNIQISGNYTQLYTNNSLNVTWNYFDADNDIEMDPIIIWTKNYVNQTSYVNQKIIPYTATKKDEIWTVKVYAFDGENYSLLATATVTIQNTVPVVNYVYLISSSAENSTVTSNINLLESYTDLDNDAVVIAVYWYKNNQYQLQLYGDLVVDKSLLTKGDQWYAVIAIYDGTDLSANKTTQTILIINSAPSISTNPSYASSLYTNFHVEDENLTVSYSFSDPDQSDTDHSIIYWYKDGVRLLAFDNRTTIYANELEPNSTYYYEIIPYDNFDLGVMQTSISRFVESRPQINNEGVVILTTQEGQFIFWANVTDLLNSDTLTVQFLITFENETSVIQRSANFNGTFWIVEYSFSDLKSFNAFMDTIGYVHVSVSTTTQGASIKNDEYYNFTVKDVAPPRVKNVFYKVNDESHPTNITFFAEVEDFGYGIDTVYLSYSFQSTVQTTSAGSFKINQDFKRVQMIKVNDTYYSITLNVDFTSDTIILYNVETTDLGGNTNANAYPLGLDKTRENSVLKLITTGLSTDQVLGIVLLMAVLLLSISFVIVKKFRSTELVGLDKELVLAKINDLDEVKDVLPVMDLHSLGIIMSFFDQRHGPIPIITTPAILTDNYNMLVDISDLSFSTGRFSSDFDSEIFHQMDFQVGPGTQINIISFSFALDRPNARGGAENVSLNLLLHPHVTELISNFVPEFRDRIHEIHVLMDKHSDEKDKINQKIEELRIHISKIILAYENLYGTTEILDSFEQVFES